MLGAASGSTAVPAPRDGPGFLERRRALPRKRFRIPARSDKRRPDLTQRQDRGRDRDHAPAAGRHHQFDRRRDRFGDEHVGGRDQSGLDAADENPCAGRIRLHAQHSLEPEIECLLGRLAVGDGALDRAEPGQRQPHPLRTTGKRDRGGGLLPRVRAVEGDAGPRGLGVHGERDRRRLRYPRRAKPECEHQQHGHGTGAQQRVSHRRRQRLSPEARGEPFSIGLAR